VADLIALDTAHSLKLNKQAAVHITINQSINLYLSQAKAHTNTHAHTHTQKTTTMYNKRNKKRNCREETHIHCQESDTLIFLTRLFTEQFNLVVM